MPSQTATKLAKNTFFMYFRMAFLMIIALYASRVILEKLGVVDYGIYNLVGSVVSLFGALKSLFLTSTQRFLSVDIGRNDVKSLIKTFNHGIYINAFFAVTIIIAAELVGVWYFNGHMNVDATRLEAAKWVFHFSVFSIALMVFNSSFEALCIAHEKMSFYAYVSIAESILNLIIIFLIDISPIDKLSFYALLRFSVSLIIVSIYFIYCKSVFYECRLSKCYDQTYLKQMVGFSGWSFLGGMSYTVSQQGLNIVLNIFGGPVVNAARGIAYQVSAAIRQFSDNILIAIRPYSIKTYSEGNFEKTIDLLFLYTKITYCIQLCIVVPIIFCAPEILKLWLGIVPDYSIGFVQLVLLNTLIWSFHPAVDLLFMANGDIKLYQITEGILFVIPLLFSYLLLFYGCSYYAAFVCLIVFAMIDIIAVLFIAKKKLNFPLASFYTNVISHCFITIIICGLFFWYAYQIDKLAISILFIFLSLIISLVYLALICLNKKERHQLLELIKIHHG